MKVPLSDNKVGKYLKSLRIGMGISQSKLADITGLSVSHICRMEKGNRLPSGFVIVKLARVFGLDEKELLTMTGYIEATQTPRQVESTRHLEAKIDPLVVNTLAQETPELQRQIIEVLQMLKKTAGVME